MYPNLSMYLISILVSTRVYYLSPFDIFDRDGDGDSQRKRERERERERETERDDVDVHIDVNTDVGGE